MNHLDTKRSQHQIVGFNYLRAVAAIAIIVLHATYACGLQYRRSISLASFISTNSITNLMMWAVPCFVMVTGALLLNPEHEVTIEKVYKKYLLRVVRALVIFVLLYQVFDMLISPQGFTWMGLLTGVGKIFTGKTWSPMWYLYMLIGLYLLLPIYRRVVQACTDQELRYLLLIYFIFIAVLPLSQVFGVKINFTIHVASIYPFYLFAGYAIKNDILKIDKPNAWGFIVGCAIFIILFTRLRYLMRIPAMNLLWEYSSAVIVLLSCSIFALVCRIQNPAPKTMHQVLLQIDSCSFGIYLTHVIFLKWLTNVLGYNPYLYGYGILGYIGLVLILLILSFAVTWIERAIVKTIKKQ